MRLPAVAAPSIGISVTSMLLPLYWTRPICWILITGVLSQRPGSAGLPSDAIVATRGPFVTTFGGAVGASSTDGLSPFWEREIGRNSPPPTADDASTAGLALSACALSLPWPNAPRFKLEHPAKAAPITIITTICFMRSPYPAQSAPSIALCPLPRTRRVFTYNV